MAQVFKLQKVAQEFVDPMFFPSKALFVHSTAGERVKIAISIGGKKKA